MPICPAHRDHPYPLKRIAPHFYFCEYCHTFVYFKAGKSKRQRRFSLQPLKEVGKHANAKAITRRV